MSRVRECGQFKENKPQIFVHKLNVKQYVDVRLDYS